MKQKLMRVQIMGTGIAETFDAVSHEIVGLPAGTYHKFVLPSGVTTYYNDFGVRTVSISDAPTNRN